MPTPEELAEQQAAAEAREKALNEIELNEDDNTAIGDILKKDHGSLVGEELEKARGEVTKTYKENLLKKAEDDRAKFDAIKQEKDWAEKTDDEIWAELERREDEEDSSSALSEALGISNENSEEEGKTGKKPSAEAQQKLSALQKKVEAYEALMSEDPLFKNYVTAANSGQKKTMLELLQQNPVLTLNLSEIQKNPKRAYEAHLYALNQKYGDEVMSAEQVRDKVAAFDDLDGEDKAKKIAEAQTYLKQEQSDQLKQMGLTLEKNKGEQRSGKVDTEALKAEFKTSLDGLKGTKKLGLKIDAKIADKVLNHIENGFRIDDPKTGKVDTEKVILYSLIDLYPSEIANALYKLGAQETERRHQRHKSRSRTLAKTGAVSSSGGTSSWDAFKAAEAAEKKNKGSGGERKQLVDIGV